VGSIVFSGEFQRVMLSGSLTLNFKVYRSISCRISDSYLYLGQTQTAEVVSWRSWDVCTDTPVPLRYRKLAISIRHSDPGSEFRHYLTCYGSEMRRDDTKCSRRPISGLIPMY